MRILRVLMPIFFFVLAGIVTWTGVMLGGSAGAPHSRRLRNMVQNAANYTGGAINRTVRGLEVVGKAVAALPPQQFRAQPSPPGGGLGGHGTRHTSVLDGWDREGWKGVVSDGVGRGKGGACARDKERVEAELFNALDYGVMADVLLPRESGAPPWCNLTALLAVGRGEHPWGGSRAARARVRVWMNNQEKALHDGEVEHGFVGWLGEQSGIKGKETWRVGLVRGVASAWIRLLVGPQPFLNLFDRLYERVLVQVDRAGWGGDGRLLEVLYKKNWGAGAYPDPVNGLLREMPELDVFLWNVGLHAMWAPLPLIKRYKPAAQRVKAGSFVKDVEGLARTLPVNVSMICMLTNTVCNCTKAASTEGVDDEGGFMFNRNGSVGINAASRDAVARSQRPIRVMDSFRLTDGRCGKEFTDDGYHFAQLDDFKLVSLAMDLAAWPPPPPHAGGAGV